MSRSSGGSEWLQYIPVIASKAIVMQVIISEFQCPEANRKIALEFSVNGAGVHQIEVPGDAQCGHNVFADAC